MEKWNVKHTHKQSQNEPTVLVFCDANRLDMKNQLDKSKWLNSEIPETESVQTQTEETSHCVFLPYNQSTTDKGSDLEETSYQAWHCLCD